MEQPYTFRQELEQVHQPSRRRDGGAPSAAETTLDDGWTLLLPRGGPEVLYTAARDFQDYLLVSMGVSCTVAWQAGAEPPAHSVWLGLQLPGMIPAATAGSSVIDVRADRIVISGADGRGVFQATIHLEDLMNLRGGPYLLQGRESRTPLFSPRMAHSRWALDIFPDRYLNQMAHAGLDSILVYTHGAHRLPGVYVSHLPESPDRYCDFNDLVRRCARYGLDMYAYADIEGRYAPDDPRALEYYRSTYGELFRQTPGIKGITLVGESVEFPSRDEHCSGVPYKRKGEPGLTARPDRPAPGWFPCHDYVEWLEILKQVIRPHNPTADIVLWTYNWGYVEEKPRLDLIRRLPTDITLLVTFEMFEEYEDRGMHRRCCDYTLSFPGPGRYFASEAKLARERGLKLYAMSNTGGLTWDFGTIPYQPAPLQWLRRVEGLKRAHDEWNLSGLMEGHHYGWSPSFVSDLVKACVWTPAPEPTALLRALAVRDFGEEGADAAMEAWALWSDAAGDCAPEDEDQYGPLRIGPAFPWVFQKPIDIPVPWHSRLAPLNGIVNANAGPSARALADDARLLRQQIRSFQEMERKMDEGARKIEEVVDRLPDHRREHARKMAGLGRFMARTCATTVHTKQWHLLRQRLLSAPSAESADGVRREMAALAGRERENVELTIPLVENDSRLGYEPTMEYATTPDRMAWKLAHLKDVLDVEIPAWCEQRWPRAGTPPKA